MKKYLIVIAAATVLAGCAKNEVVTPGANTPAEITFTTAPITKGHPTFSTDNVFQTYAYYSADDFAYSENGEQFIDWSKVSHGTDDNWRIADKHYFWPKDGGKLSFFSWSLNKSGLNFASESASPAVNPSVTFSATQGVQLTGYSCLQNDDFMVAEPALNQAGNGSLTYYRVGVPTLFHHKAAQIKFRVKTSKAYTDREFSLTDISFVKVSTSGNYVQGNNLTGTGAVPEAWTPVASGETTVHFSGDLTITADGKTVTDVPTGSGTYILVPQNFTAADTDKVLSVTYTVTPTGGTPTSKTATISMNKLLGGNDAATVALQMGKIYTVTLSISTGNEILWDPYVVDWLTTDEEVSVS